MKKVLGILFIVIGSVLSLAILVTIPGTILTIVETLHNNTANHWGYLLGSMSITVTFTVITFFLFMFGVRYIKK